MKLVLFFPVLLNHFIPQRITQMPTHIKMNMKIESQTVEGIPKVSWKEEVTRVNRIAIALNNQAKKLVGS